MSSIERYQRPVPARALRRAVAALHQDADLSMLQADLKIDTIAHTTERALLRLAMVSRVREAAEQLAPSGAALYEAIAIAGAVEMGQIINGMSRR